MADFSTVVVTQATQTVTLHTVQQVVRVNSSVPGSYADAEAFLQLYHGTGSPEGVVAAPVGARYRQTDGTEETAWWVKTRGTGNTGWTVAPVTVATPSGFTGWVPTAIERQGRTFTVKESVTQFKGSGKTYYVGFSGASDSNDGLTRATSFASTTKAYTTTDYDVIVVNAGLYDRTKAGLGTVTRSHTLIGEGGDAILSAHERISSLTWTLESGTCWKATVGTVRGVCDARYTDAFGDYAICALVADSATCISTMQSWYYDSGTTTLYVNLPDGREPDAEVRVYLSLSRLTIQSNIAVYVENIRIEGGNAVLFLDNTSATTGSARPTCYAKHCRFSYSGTTNGVTAQGAITWFEDCKAAHNFRDGFNYHLDGAVPCDSVEVDCEGYDNGYDSANLGINNGSTTHDGNAILRVNGSYHDNEGPNVADVNSALSWNLGCTAYASRTAQGGAQPTNYYADATMWLDHCDSAASTYDYAQVTSGVIYTRDCSDLQVEYAGSTVQE